MSPIVTRWIDSVFPRRVPAARRHRLRPGWIEKLESRCLLTVTLSDIANLNMAGGKDTLVALPSTDSNASATVTYTVSSSNSTVSAQVLTGGRSLKINVSGKDSSNANFTGDMTLRLFESEAPETTARIIQLVNSGFYTGLKFHRVVNNFVIQGGDPAGNGTGGSGTKFGDEFNTDLTFTSRGLLAMANSGSDTNDSQFFITDTKLPLAQMPQNLNFKHTIFGILTSGFDVYQKVITTPVNGETPVTNVVINSVSVFQDNLNGVVRLSSPTGSSGTSTITVTANDGTGPVSKSFTATTAADTTNDRAFLGTVSNQTTTQNTPVSFDVTGFDVQKDTLTFVVKDPTSFSGSNSTGNAPANLTSSITVTPASGTTPAKAHITLTPANGFTGTISMIIGVRDQTNRGGTSLDSRTNFDTQQITLTVTAAVTKATADSAVVGENTAGNKIDVLANDTVKSGAGSLTITAVTQGAHGTVAIASDGKSVTFTPTKDYNGSDAFTYTVKDSQNATSTATVTLTVANNDRMFRLYNPTLNDYLFTITTAEYQNALKNGYTDETTGRPGFSVLGSQATSSVTIFRLVNIAENLHYLTLSAGEKDFLVGLIPSTSPDAGKVGWKLESSGSFMYSTQQTGTTEVFHLYNKDTGGHLFTDDQSEVTQILTKFPNTWVQHHSLGFAFKAAASSSSPASSSLFSAEQGQSAPLTLATATQGEAAQSATAAAPVLAQETTAETGNDVPALPQTDDLSGFGSDEIAAATTTSSTTTAPQSTITTIATIPGTTTAYVPDAATPPQDDPAAFQSNVQWGGGDVEDAPETGLVDEVFSDVANLDL